MAIVFSDNFNSGTFTGWTSNSLATLALWGNAYTYCSGCNLATSQARKTFSAGAFVNQGAVRGQVACILTSTDATDGGPLWDVQEVGSGAGANRYQVVCYLRPDGSFRIRWNNNGVSTFINSAAGLFPVDGTQFGLQMLFQIKSGGLNNSVEFIVNNVSVATLTFVHTHAANYWDDFFLYGWRLPVTLANPITSLITVDNLELDSVAASVAWPAGTAPKLTVDACSGPPIPPITTTVYEVRCERVFLLPSSPTLKKMFLKRLEFVLQTAVGLSTGQGSDPQMMISISRDGGRSWGPEFWLSMGKIGEFRRAYKNALWNYRHGAVKVVISDPVFIALLGADATLEEGIS